MSLGQGRHAVRVDRAILGVPSLDESVEGRTPLSISSEHAKCLTNSAGLAAELQRELVENPLIFAPKTDSYDSHLATIPHILVYISA